MKLKRKIQINLVKIVGKIFCLFPIDSKKVVFTSFYGKYYNDAPKCISEKITDDCGIKKVWVLNSRKDCPDNIKIVKPFSLKELYALQTAKVWVDNSRKELWVTKRKGQFYIQTWHGGVALKKVEADAEKKLSSYYVKSAKHDSSMIDCFVSESKWRTQNIRSAFWYSGEIIEAAIMRSDNTGNTANNVRNYYNFSDDQKILLYAPTFRKDKRLDCYNIDFSWLRDSLSQRFGGNWVIIVRLHPNISGLENNITYSDFVFDGTKYPNINELIAECEMLITDYSGCMFDGFRLGKKVILYATDLQKYVTEERGLYFDLNQLPSPLCRDNEELNAKVSLFQEEAYELARKQFVDGLGFSTVDGTQIIADLIQEKCLHND